MNKTLKCRKNALKYHLTGSKRRGHETRNKDNANWNSLSFSSRSTIDEGDKAVFFQKLSQICAIVDGCLVLRYPDFAIENPVIPQIKKQEINLTNLQYVGFQNTHEHDSVCAQNKTVGFFLRDEKFEHVCHRPWEYVYKLSQYKQVLTPDLSCFIDMPIEEQWMNTYQSHLAGSFWQHCGLIVVPTVSWSDERSYGFCFDGLEKGSIVAVSTIGTGSSRHYFMAGFRELCRIVEPQAVICYCNPYPEMHRLARIVTVEHEGRKAWRQAKYRPIPGQLSLFEEAG